MSVSPINDPDVLLIRITTREVAEMDRLLEESLNPIEGLRERAVAARDFFHDLDVTEVMILDAADALVELREGPPPLVPIAEAAVVVPPAPNPYEMITPAVEDLPPLVVIETPGVPPLPVLDISEEDFQPVSMCILVFSYFLAPPGSPDGAVVHVDAEVRRGCVPLLCSSLASYGRPGGELVSCPSRCRSCPSSSGCRW
ncbi:uncharacterized protein LOC127751086 [Frankliniella occidentalis]|uniref:Uncharacterized protein LOC127751086 n=1 Tax=Frankliniella occidentalis TaxID=133901 RepID=A0A9C6X6E2_FRAOC|nr:uncharacterized protein LOC127751086 [Frankliniella occidentalis]